VDPDPVKNGFQWSKIIGVIDNAHQLSAVSLTWLAIKIDISANSILDKTALTLASGALVVV
jgi:hypothetical protein